MRLFRVFAPSSICGGKFARKTLCEFSPARGFTLLEVLVASLILSLTLVAMATVFVAAARQAQMSSHKTAALYHATEVLNMLSSYVADEPPGGFGPPEDDGAGPNGWFEANIRNGPPNWQSCTSAAGPWADCWALFDPPGAGATNHFINPAALSADFTVIGGSVTYSVETNPAGFPSGWKRVIVRVGWNEPQ